MSLRHKSHRLFFDGLNKLAVFFLESMVDGGPPISVPRLVPSHPGLFVQELANKEKRSWQPQISPILQSGPLRNQNPNSEQETLKIRGGGRASHHFAPRPPPPPLNPGTA